jgi:hypothetical protein
MKKPIDFYGTPNIESLTRHKIFLDIQPIDDWDNWYCKIYFQDAMSPFFEVYKKGVKKHFKSYREAFNDAIDWLSINEYINIIELPF